MLGKIFRKERNQIDKILLLYPTTIINEWKDNRTRKELINVLNIIFESVKMACIKSCQKFQIALAAPDSLGDAFIVLGQCKACKRVNVKRGSSWYLFLFA